jgi:prepilin-type processing-associated H-X9-DG protein
MMEYASDYNQYVLPARLNTTILTSSQLYWWSPFLIGNELGHADMTSNATRELATQTIVKILTCPAADHTLDPPANNTNNEFTGDYTYNENLGAVDLTTTPPTITTPFERLVQVPSNVVVMTDMDKAYAEGLNLSTTEESTLSIFLQPNYLLGNHLTPPAGWATQPPNMWIPHTKGTKANVLFIDGHISTLSPNDFVLPGSGASINTSTTPWTYNQGTGNSVPNMPLQTWMIDYYKAGNNPPWTFPWIKGAPSL